MAVYTHISAAQAQLISTTYNLGQILGLEPIAEGSVNSNYRLTTASGAYFLRIDERRGPPSLTFESSLLTHLASVGFPTPPPLRTQNGGAFQPFETKYVLVFPLVAGRARPVNAWGGAHTQQAAEAMASLHKAGTTFPGQLLNPFGITATTKRWQQSVRPAFRDAGLAERIDAALAHSTTELQNLQAEPSTIHGDFFADNLLFDESDHLVAVLDFEAACIDDIYFDLGTALNALAWPDIDNTPRVGTARDFLDRYQTCRPEFRLSREKLDAYLRLTALRFTVSRIADFAMTQAVSASGAPPRSHTDFWKKYLFWESHSSAEEFSIP